MVPLEMTACLEAKAKGPSAEAFSAGRGRPRGVGASTTCRSAGPRSPRANTRSPRAEAAPARLPWEAMSRTCDGQAVGVMARLVC